jgi:hypothetical protein
MNRLIQIAWVPAYLGAQCLLLGLPSSVKADPWEGHQECITRETFRGPALFCQEGDREHHHHWDRDWRWSGWRQAVYERPAAAYFYGPMTPIVTVDIPMRGGRAVALGAVAF